LCSVLSHRLFFFGFVDVGVVGVGISAALVVVVVAAAVIVIDTVVRAALLAIIPAGDGHVAASGTGAKQPRLLTRVG